jgi:antitoxin YefM
MVILMTMSTIPLAEVKAHLSELVARVRDHHERISVTVHGQPSAVLVAPDDLEALEETIAVLSDQELVRQLTESEADLAAGRVETAEELASAMRRRRASA